MNAWLGFYTWRLWICQRNQQPQTASKLAQSWPHELQTRWPFFVRTGLKVRSLKKIISRAMTNSLWSRAIGNDLRRDYGFFHQGSDKSNKQIFSLFLKI